MNHRWHHDRLIERARTRGLDKSSLSGYYECHHIVLRSFGGSDDNDNLVLLTAREHFIIHVLLCYMYPNNGKLLRAHILMSGQGKYNSTSYTKLKSEYSIVVSESNSKRVWKQESKDKLSIAGKGRKVRQETINKIITKNTGKKRTKEQIESQSKRMQGNIVTAETRKKISEGNIGKRPWNKGKEMMWLYNPKSKVTRQVLLSNTIPEGFIRGRGPRGCNVRL